MSENINYREIAWEQEEIGKAEAEKVNRFIKDQSDLGIFFLDLKDFKQELEYVIYPGKDFKSKSSKKAMVPDLGLRNFEIKVIVPFQGQKDIETKDNKIVY